MGRTPESGWQGDERRQAARTRLLDIGHLSFAGEAESCLILNLSARGAEVRCSRELGPGVEGRLDLPGIGSLAVRVVWCRDAALGLEFLGAPDEITRAIGGLSPVRSEAS